MRFTIVHGAKRETLDFHVNGATIGGDPAKAGGIAHLDPLREVPWRALLQPREMGWTITPVGLPSKLNGEVLPYAETPVHPGDVIVVGATTIIFHYLEMPLPSAPPLDDIERTLLARVGAEGTDLHARRVLADHWLEHGDAARGELVHLQCEAKNALPLVGANGKRWLRTATAAGFQNLDFARGFASHPLVVERDEPLCACPDAWRLSPRQYIPVRAFPWSYRHRIVEAVARTLSGEHGRYVLKATRIGEHASIHREAAILARMAHPHVMELFDLAKCRDEGDALVMPWAGAPLVVGKQPDEPRAIEIGLQLCAALTATAAAGVVHMHVDVPQVLVREDGHVTLSDFTDALAPDIASLPSLHLHSIPVRRFRHMAPEQVRGQKLTPMTDLYSLAVLIAWIALGRHPLPRMNSDFEILQAIANGSYDLPTTTPLLALCRATLTRQPADRPTIAEFAQRLANP